MIADLAAIAAVTLLIAAICVVYSGHLVPRGVVKRQWRELERARSRNHYATALIREAKRCRHREAVPVESGGEVVAHLCTTCDAQLPAEWRR